MKGEPKGSGLTFFRSSFSFSCSFLLSYLVALLDLALPKRPNTLYPCHVQKESRQEHQMGENGTPQHPKHTAGWLCRALVAQTASLWLMSSIARSYSLVHLWLRAAYRRDHAAMCKTPKLHAHDARMHLSFLTFIGYTPSQERYGTHTSMGVAGAREASQQTPKR